MMAVSRRALIPLLRSVPWRTNRESVGTVVRFYCAILGGPDSVGVNLCVSVVYPPTAPPEAIRAKSLAEGQ